MNFEDILNPVDERTSTAQTNGAPKRSTNGVKRKFEPDDPTDNDSGNNGKERVNSQEPRGRTPTSDVLDDMEKEMDKLFDAFDVFSRYSGMLLPWHPTEDYTDFDATELQRQLQLRIAGVSTNVVPPLSIADILDQTPSCSLRKVPYPIGLEYLFRHRKSIIGIANRPTKSNRKRNPLLCDAIWYYGLNPSYSWDSVHGRSRVQFLLLLPGIKNKEYQSESIEYRYAEAFIEAFCDASSFERRDHFLHVWRSSPEEQDIIQFTQGHLHRTKKRIQELRDHYAVLEHTQLPSSGSQQSGKRDQQIRTLALKLMKCLLDGKPQPLAQFSVPASQPDLQRPTSREGTSGNNPLVEALNVLTPTSRHPKEVALRAEYPSPRTDKVFNRRFQAFDEAAVPELILGIEELLRGL